MKVLDFGSLNYDYTYNVDHIVTAGETENTSGRKTFFGGKGLNQAVALAKAGVSVYMAGCVGDDGEDIISECKRLGINTDYIRKVEGPTGHAIIQVDKDGQNSILLYGGANQRQTKEFINKVLSDFKEGDILLLQNEVNLLGYIIDMAYQKNMMIILNPSPYNERLEECDYDKISMFMINEVEGKQITGENDTEKILEKLKELYPKARVVLTLGDEGAVYQYKNQRINQKIYKVPVVDTTAAGDTFTGYFVSSIINGMSVTEGLDLAARAAAIAVSRQGAVNSIPEKKEVLNYRW